VVVTDHRVILGDLRGRALEANPRTPIAEVMNPAPTTYLPNIGFHEMAHELENSGARRVLLSDGDGCLLGVLSRESVGHHFKADGPLLASTFDIGGNAHE
jgi:hypothetical protein